ncbi:MAG: M56 family metallopeptidase [Planctomycetaceae bacterium]|nr:M56 family metallopeptidase [Planctomycetaceae bacterium]
MTPAQFLETMLSLSLQLALVILLTSGAARLGNTDEVRSRLWALCHVLIIAITLRGFLLPRLTVVHPWSGISPAAAVDLAHFERQAGIFLLVIWVAGAIISAIILLASCWKIRQFLKTCQPVESDRLPELQGELTGRQSTRILSSRVLRSPFCWQIHEPVVVVPEFLLDFEPEERRLIFRHELEHLRTGHPVQLFLQRTVELFYWFHPLVWWSSRRVELAREFACDEGAVRSDAEVAGYLRCLLKIVEQPSQEDTSRGIDLAFGRGAITQRATRLAAKARRAFWTGQPAAGNSIVPLAMLVTFTLLVSFVWIPVDVLKTSRSHWSPWPTWTAAALHTVGSPVRDYDVYDTRSQLYELMEDAPSATED